MSRYRRRSSHAEVGWISTTDVFIFGTCFLMLISVVAIKSRDSLQEKLNVQKQDFVEEQRKINNQIVGFGGEFSRVAFLVDVSSSMKGENNWEPALERISTWINNLNVSEVALISFGNDAEILLPMAKMNDNSRLELINVLDTLEPTDKSTNFLAAFKTAFSIEAMDTIVIFSDGLPTIDVFGEQIRIENRTKNESQEQYKQRRIRQIAENRDKILAVRDAVSDLAKSNPNVAINAIGLGEKVYHEQIGNMLNDLALKHNGIFLAFPSKTDSSQP